MNSTNRVARVSSLPRLAAPLAVFGLAIACVTENTTTGEMVPRGNQRYEWSKVEKASDRLVVGMSKSQVEYLLGSPAEKDKNGDVWVYLPERYGILIPAKALRLEFRQGLLTDFGFQTIVLGARI
jgi:outer membrane protein assembly factor BamE (lipoprotein component of BamABCDE complex)